MVQTEANAYDLVNLSIPELLARQAQQEEQVDALLKGGNIDELVRLRLGAVLHYLRPSELDSRQEAIEAVAFLKKFAKVAIEEQPELSSTDVIKIYNSQQHETQERLKKIFGGDKSRATQFIRLYRKAVLTKSINPMLSEAMRAKANAIPIPPTRAGSHYRR